MQISLVTTTRNRVDFLLDCALSVANQSFPCHQWVIYVDDDLDKYAEVLHKVKALVPQTMIIGGNKVGRVKALTLAHMAVTGDYCGLLDDDDWLDPECLKECNRWDSGIIYTDFYCVENGHKALGARNRENYSWQRMLENNIMFHFRLYKMALYNAVGGFDLSFDTTMDYELTLRMLATNPIITKINLPLYYYRVHPDSITGKYRQRQIENKRRAVAKYAISR